ncbi:MAG: hypothetical protein GY758_34485 [Fuerstiella sp.]|nr:hypothetical protein [Fuerstiella sp.]
MSPEQVPAGGPGKFTDTPTDHELFWHNMLEIPRTGSECDARFNCMECNQNGYCSQHPNGCRSGLYGKQSDGCTTGAYCPADAATRSPGATAVPEEPMLISPETEPKIQTPTPDIGLPIPEAAVRGRIDGAAKSSAIRPASAEVPSKRRARSNSQATGLISPLMR